VTIVFFGTSSFAVPPLRVLVESGRRPALVVTQKARPAGRGRKVQTSPVAELAAAHDLPLIDPEHVADREVVTTLAEARPDLFVVVAYGQKLTPEVLAVPRLGAFNIHGSLLPLLRGAAPIQRAILSGFTETGVTLLRITERMDAGPIAAQRAVPIGAQETAGELHDRLAELGASLLREMLPALESGSAPALAQDDRIATRAPKLTKEEGHVSFAQAATRVSCVVRGLSPWPGAYCFHEPQGKPPRRLILLRATAGEDGKGEPGQVTATGRVVRVACAPGTLEVTELMQEGRSPMMAEEFLRGYPLRAGDRLT
jgi:methionyl-tRNA formyltransferase